MQGVPVLKEKPPRETIITWARMQSVAKMGLGECIDPLIPLLEPYSKGDWTYKAYVIGYVDLGPFIPDVQSDDDSHEEGFHKGADEDP